MQDCVDGKVDLILTQLISSVSKDPHELSFTARMLAAQRHPIGIYFISEDVFTLASYYLEDLRDVNMACIQKFPEVDHVQVLVNKDTKLLAIMPCPENARDSFAWCSISKGKRKCKGYARIRSRC